MSDPVVRALLEASNAIAEFSRTEMPEHWRVIARAVEWLRAEAARVRANRP